MASAPGWYSDPTGKRDLRYWDGNAWTQRTRNRTATRNDTTAAANQPRPKTTVSRARSEICLVGWTWRDTKTTDRRTRKHFPFELWFVANALGPNGLYVAGESDVLWNDASSSYYQRGLLTRQGATYYNSTAPEIPRDEYTEASFNGLARRLWKDGWEPVSGGGRGSLWYEYRFRRAVTD